MSTGKISRVWAMPNSCTFQIKPIREFVLKYVDASKVSVDPYARNSRWCTYTNDLNPHTMADYHMDSLEFVEHLAECGVKADLIIHDPPYSPRQVKEMYDGIGRKMKQDEALLGFMRKRLKAAFMRIATPDMTVLTFGWNSVGMGVTLGFHIEEIMLVCHGSDHNDTICVAERRND